MKKSRLLMILALSLALLAMAVFCTACGGESAEDTKPAQQGEAPATETPVPETTVDPNAVATVTTGDKTVAVYDLAGLLEAIDASGNSVVTLYKDIENNKAVEVPYSCTVDFNGHTVTTNPQQGLGIQIRAAGSENATTTLKNGQVVSYSDSVRVKEGAIVISGMTLHTAYGHSVALYDTSEEYKDINRIENTLIVSAAGAGLSFSENGMDFSATGITLSGVDMICPKAGGSHVITKQGGETVPGAVNLEDKVNLYAYGATACPNAMPFTGKLPVKETGATATDGENTYTDMTLWTTESDKEVLDVLMIGSSSCYYFVEEMYAVADAAGIQMNVANLYRAGCTIKSHWEFIEDPAQGAGKCQLFISGPLGRYKHPVITTTPESLELTDWDVICVQQPWSATRAANYDNALASCTPYAENMINYIREQCPDAELYWHQNWAYAVGYQHPDNEDEDTSNDDPSKDILSVAVRDNIHSVIRQVSLTICEENDVKRVPSGDAWQIARARVGETLTKTDMAHDGDVQGGQYLNACVWVETLTGESCIGNTWRPTTYTVAEEKILELQKAAHEAVAALEE